MRWSYLLLITLHISKIKTPIAQVDEDDEIAATQWLFLRTCAPFIFTCYVGNQTSKLVIFLLFNYLFLFGR